MTMHKLKKDYHKLMAKRHHRKSGGSPLLWSALGIGAMYLLRKRGHHKIEVE